MLGLQKKFAGWAADAHAEMTSEELRSMVQRMLDHHANMLWIGHNNPGEVDAAKGEPALSYAVYESFINKSSPLHEDAKAMIEAQFRLLEACRDLEMPVVFPVGYQIQMGRLWNERHPSELRRDLEGNVINWGGVSASFYSEIYQRDIQEFYRWAVETFIEPFKNIILMVNLSDEPFGGDYSPIAEKVFRQKRGFGFREADGDIERQKLIGEFQSDYIVEYAKWSADAWGEICPETPCTMTFCGWHGRLGNTYPTAPKIFSETPDNFQVTFDAYPRDGAPSNIIAETNDTSLIAFLRHAGRLSGKYDKPLWLWSTGNSWGLGQASEEKADIADAIANQLHLAMAPVDAGAKLAGIAVWNYNVKHQGLYLDTNPIIYEPDDMFRKVSATFPTLREIAAFGKRSEENIILYAPMEYEYAVAGETLSLYSFKLYDLEVISVLAKNDFKFNLIADLDELSPECNTLISLVPEIEYFSDIDIEKIRGFVNNGGKFVGHRELTRAIFGDEAADAPVLCQGDEELPDVREIAVGDGKVYAVSGSIEECLDDQLDCHYAPFWRNCLCLESHSGAYVITNSDRAAIYNISGRKALIRGLKAESLSLLNRHGEIRDQISGSEISQTRLDHHEIALSGFDAIANEIS